MTPDDRHQIVEQIRRDTLVLSEHTAYHVPSRAFYEGAHSAV